MQENFKLMCNESRIYLNVHFLKQLMKKHNAFLRCITILCYQDTAHDLALNEQYKIDAEMDVNMYCVNMTFVLLHTHIYINTLGTIGESDQGHKIYTELIIYR